MCGRFVSSSTPDEIARYFTADAGDTALEPRYNVAPTDDVYVVLADGGVRRLAAHHWGLVPRFAKDASVGNRMINARAESITEKNVYKHAFRRRRCIVPADGFYEWTTVPGRKTRQPYLIQRVDGEPLALAGLWEGWRPEGADGDDTLRSCVIITTEANATVVDLHDRMPVILPPSAWDAWLDPANRDVESLERLLVPAPPELLVARPVSTEVNNVRSDGPQLIDPIDLSEAASETVPTQATLL